MSRDVMAKKPPGGHPTRIMCLIDRIFGFCELELKNIERSASKNKLLTNARLIIEQSCKKIANELMCKSKLDSAVEFRHDSCHMTLKHFKLVFEFDHLLSK